MGCDYSYQCRSIQIDAILDHVQDKRDRDVLLCTFQCEDEHGHKLAEGLAIVVHDGETAQIEDEADNILPETCTDDEYNLLQGFCEQAPDYEFYNPEEVAEMVRDQLAARG